MKLLHQATPDVLLQLENTQLRRENARLGDELASIRRELATARKVHQVEIDDLLDLSSTYVLAAPAERLGAPQVFPWDQSCHDSRELTVDQAHTVMQLHRRCLTGECQARTTAVRVLREAGHLVPDSSRPAYNAAVIS